MNLFLVAFAIELLISKTTSTDRTPSPSRFVIEARGLRKRCPHSNPGKEFIVCAATCDEEPCRMSMHHDGQTIQTDDHHWLYCWNWNVTFPPRDTNVPPITIRAAGCSFGATDVDETDGGVYRCYLAAGDTVKTKALHITILSEKPRIEHRNSTVIVLRGRSLTVSCCALTVCATSPPSPTQIKLFHKGRPLSSADNVRSAVSCRNYTIKQARPRDAGAYTCVARNFAGSTNQTYKVKVLRPARVICFSDDDRNCNQFVWILRGNSATLLCRALGIPAPSLQITCPNGRNSRHVVANIVSLTIDEFDDADVGLCTCSANNNIGGHGTSKMTVSINVCHGVRIVSFRALNTDRNYFAEGALIQNGAEVLLVCNATGYPSPSVYLYDPHMNLVGEGLGTANTSILCNSTRETYSCWTLNVRSVVNATANVDCAITQKASGVFWELSLGIAFVLAIVVFAIIVLKKSQMSRPPPPRQLPVNQVREELPFGRQEERQAIYKQGQVSGSPRERYKPYGATDWTEVLSLDSSETPPLMGSEENISAVTI